MTRALCGILTTILLAASASAEPACFRFPADSFRCYGAGCSETTIFDLYATGEENAIRVLTYAADATMRARFAFPAYHVSTSGDFTVAVQYGPSVVQSGNVGFKVGVSCAKDGLSSGRSFAFLVGNEGTLAPVFYGTSVGAAVKQTTNTSGDFTAFNFVDNVDCTYAACKAQPCYVWVQRDTTVSSPDTGAAWVAQVDLCFEVQ